MGPPCNPSLPFPLPISPLLVCVRAVVQNPLQITSVRSVDVGLGLGRGDLQGGAAAQTCLKLQSPASQGGREGGVVSVI